MEEHEVRDAEGDTGSQKDILHSDKSKSGMQDFIQRYPSQPTNPIHSVSLMSPVSHREDGKDKEVEKDNKNGTVTPDKTDKDEEDHGKFSFDGFMDHIEADEKDNLVPTVEVGNRRIHGYPPHLS